MPFLSLLFFTGFVATLLSIFDSVLFKFNCLETDNFLVTTESCFELLDHIGLSLELYQVVKTCGLFLNWVCQLSEAPILLIYNFSTIPSRASSQIPL